MELSQQVVSLQLAMRLKELGVKQESLFYWYKLSIQKDYSLEMRRHMVSGELIVADCSDYISAFTVAELGEMLPIGIEYFYRGNNDHVITHSISKYNYKQIADKTEANARAKMLIYLLENGLY